VGCPNASEKEDRINRAGNQSKKEGEKEKREMKTVKETFFF